MLLIRLGLLVGVAVTLHGAVPMLSEGPVAALAAGPKGELTPEELHARAEQFRERVGADLGDELVYRVAACLQQADEEGTLNDAWAEQCAQDIAAAARAADARGKWRQRAAGACGQRSGARIDPGDCTTGHYGATCRRSASIS
jgi:hypothetical protein